MKTEVCPLCNNNAVEFFNTDKTDYFICNNCKGVFMGKQFLPDKNFEISRYKEHNNDVNDIRYQNFVKPIVNEVLNDYTSSDIGLDFGAGTGPVISKMLSDKGYKIEQYDPFFSNYPELLEKKYDYIVCCEVIEHFHRPATEFRLLNKILAGKGKLYCKTNIYNKNIDFKKWYYKSDLTHVFFYQSETLNYICRNFGFNDIIIKNDLIIFSK